MRRGIDTVMNAPLTKLGQGSSDGNVVVTQCMVKFLPVDHIWCFSLKKSEKQIWNVIFCLHYEWSCYQKDFRWNIFTFSLLPFIVWRSLHQILIDWFIDCLLDWLIITIIFLVKSVHFPREAHNFSQNISAADEEYWRFLFFIVNHWMRRHHKRYSNASKHYNTNNMFINLWVMFNY